MSINGTTPGIGLLEQISIKKRRGGRSHASFTGSLNFLPFFDKDWYHLPIYIDLPDRKELIHGDFGKEKAPQFPVNGSIIGHCLNFKNEEWLNGMTYGEFMRVVLKVNFEPPPEDHTDLINLLNKIF